jgi:hypothetical protein
MPCTTPGGMGEATEAMKRDLHERVFADRDIYDPDTRQLRPLQTLGIPHRVVDTTRVATWTEGGQTAIEPYFYTLIHGNDATARAAAAMMNEMFDQQGSGLVRANPRSEHPTRGPCSRRRQVRALAAVMPDGLELRVDVNGDILFPDYSGAGGAEWMDQVVQTVKAAGLRGRLSSFQGEAHYVDRGATAEMVRGWAGGGTGTARPPALQESIVDAVRQRDAAHVFAVLSFGAGS